MFSLIKKLLNQDTQKTFIDTEREERIARMNEKRKKVIAEMGSLWVLHPEHKQSKLDTPRSF